MGQCAGQYNITADQGATFTRTITWLGATGSPVDNTGYTARMQVRSKYTSDTAVLSLSSPASGITLGGANGKVIITSSATVMAAVVAGEYRYDLEMVSSSGVVTRLLMGTFTVRPEVTR